MKLIVPNEVKKLASLFARHGKPLYIVGGFIRDSFLGVKNSDIDLASCATIKDIIDILYNTEFTIKVKSERLSTIEISCGELRMEHATFRREWYEGSGGHTPTSVEFVDSIEEDYIRRDFTINAIYYDITNDTIVDPCEGMVDLSHYLVKSVTIPRMVFENDGLRILRMIRLACTLVLDIDGNTFKSAKENIFRLQFISASRIRDEFSRIIQADIEHPEVEGHETAHSRGLLLLGEIGAWAYIIPQIESMRTNEMMFSGNERLYDHVIRVVELSAPEVRLSALLHDIGKETCMKMQGNFNDHAIVGAALIEDILGSEGLNYPRDVVMRVKQIIAGHNFDKYGLAFESTIRRFIF
ncbi:MAG: HD domain-containing protein [Clostridia bacterium]